VPKIIYKITNQSTLFKDASIAMKQWL